MPNCICGMIFVEYDNHIKTKEHLRRMRVLEK